MPTKVAPGAQMPMHPAPLSIWPHPRSMLAGRVYANALQKPTGS